MQRACIFSGFVQKSPGNAKEVVHDAWMRLCTTRSYFNNKCPIRHGDMQQGTVPPLARHLIVEGRILLGLTQAGRDISMPEPIPLRAVSAALRFSSNITEQTCICAITSIAFGRPCNSGHQTYGKRLIRRQQRILVERFATYVASVRQRDDSLGEFRSQTGLLYSLFSPVCLPRSRPLTEDIILRLHLLAVWCYLRWSQSTTPDANFQRHT